MRSPEEDNDTQTKFWWTGTAAVPLTYEELLKRADCWTLGADAATATLLQEISSKLIAKTHEVVSQLQKACGACDRAGVHVTNLTSSFLLLSDAQFVENRTYGEGASDERSAMQNDSALPLDQGATRLHEVDAGLFSCQQAIRNGLDLVDRVHELVQISDSDPESDLEEGAFDGSHDNNPLMVLRHLDPYATRQLPHVIGSKLFLEDIWVGLGAPAAPLQDEDTPSPTHDSSEDDSSPIPKVLLQEVKSPSVHSPLPEPQIFAKEASVSNEPAKASLFQSSSSSDAEGIFTGPLPNTAKLRRGSKVPPPPPSPSTEARVLEKSYLQLGPSDTGGAPPLPDLDPSDDDDFFVPIRKPPLRAPVGEAAPCSSVLPPSIGVPPSRRNIFDSSSDDESAIFAPRVTQESSHLQLPGSKSPATLPEPATHRPPLEATKSDDVISSLADPLSLPAFAERFPPGISVPSIFSDDEETDDIFAAPPPKKSDVKEVQREAIFSNEEAIFAGPISLSKTTNSKSTGCDFSAPPPPGLSSIFSDDEDDDLFSIGASKPKALSIPVGETGISEGNVSQEQVPKSSDLLESPCRKPTGGVALFGGPELLSKLRERRSERSPGSSPEETYIKTSSSATENSSVEPLPQEPIAEVIPARPSSLLDPVPLSPTPVTIEVETGIAFDRESRSTPLLVSVNKTRPRLQHRRKPPSKKSRRGAELVDPPQRGNSSEDAAPSLLGSPTKGQSGPPDTLSGVQKKAELCDPDEKQKKDPVTCVSIFGDDDTDDDLFSSVFPKAGLAPKQVSLFFDDDDTLPTDPLPQSTREATAISEECSLFDDDDDLFSSQTPHPQTTNSLNIKTTGLSGSAPRQSERPSSVSHLTPIEDSDDPLSKFLS